MIIRYKTDKRGKSVPVCRIYTQKEHPVRNSHIDKDALWAIRKLHALGAEAYIVGGAIRDIMLGNLPKDFDIATSATPKQVLRLFWNSRIIGRRFRIVHLFFGGKIIEVTTFRSDEENFEEGNNNIYGTIEQDSRRRDFSINSLYYNPENGQILDFNKSFEDFKKKIIRSLIPLHYSFSEDPVRMIRAVKYQVMTGFRLKLDIRFRMRRNAPLVSNVSVSRLTEELGKIISSGYSVRIFEQLQHYGLLVHLLPCYSLYIGYKSIQDSLSLLDEKILMVKNSNQELDRAEMILHLVKPLIVIDEHYSSIEEERKAIFRQIKVLISPMTPPNFELEKATDLYLAELGIKIGVKKSRAQRKKLSDKTVRKAGEDTKVVGDVVKAKRKRRKKKVINPNLIQPEYVEEAKSSALAHDL